MHLFIPAVLPVLWVLRTMMLTILTDFEGASCVGMRKCLNWWVGVYAVELVDENTKPAVESIHF